jgi:Tetratricopeptide repeat
MSLIGTKPTSRHVGWLVAFGGKADIEIIKVTPNAKAYTGRGAAFSGEEDYERAIADYTEAIRLSFDGYASAIKQLGTRP